MDSTKQNQRANFILQRLRWVVSNLGAPCLDKKIGALKVRVVRTKEEVWEKIKKCLTFNQLHVIGHRLVHGFSNSFVLRPHFRKEISTRPLDEWPTR